MSALITASLLFLSGPLAKPVTTFSALPASDTISVQYQSRGCFHRDAYVFRFRKEGRKLIVEVYDNRETWNRTNVPAKVKPVGQTVLTEEDVARLDNLIAFYRERRVGGSTTVQTIQIEQLREKTWIGAERFTDSTSIIGMPKEWIDELKMPHIDALGFREIRARVVKATEI
jgi:hypothetical protein